MLRYCILSVWPSILSLKMHWTLILNFKGKGVVVFFTYFVYSGCGAGYVNAMFGLTVENALRVKIWRKVGEGVIRF